MLVKRVKCPRCSVVLDVKNEQELPEKSFLCPNCKTQLVVKFKKKEEPVEAPTFFAAPKPNPEQQSRNQNSRAQSQDNFSFETQLGNFDASSAGSQSRNGVRLPKLIYDGVEYPLAEGRNIVGRRASINKATVPIDTQDKFMSRGHCVIEVTIKENGTTKAKLSNYENKNGTKIENHTIANGDSIALHDGNHITMGQTTLTFRK